MQEEKEIIQPSEIILPTQTQEEEINNLQSYVQSYYNIDISKEEIKNIVDHLENIKTDVVTNINDSEKNKKIKSQIYLRMINSSIKPLVKKGLPRLLVYKYKENAKNVILKIYLPDDQPHKDSVINKYINEIVFQIYATELNSTCNFTSPKLYNYGKFYLDRNLLWFDNIKYSGDCYFMLMEYLHHTPLNELMFNPNTCDKLSKKINKIDDCLGSKLLSHNDLNQNNLRIKNYDRIKEDIALIDFGEAKKVQTALVSKYGIGFEYNCDELKRRQSSVLPKKQKSKSKNKTSRITSIRTPIVSKRITIKK